MEKVKHSIIFGLMCFLLVMGMAVQIRTVNKNGNTVSSNQNINELKDQVLKMKEKYETSYQRLEIIQKELETTRTNITSNDEELKALEEEIKKDSLLLGLTDVTGPGATITIMDANTKVNPLAFDPLVHDTDILEIVNELRNAGAEAIAVNGQRITNATSIVCDGNVIVVNGKKISSPFTITAIGYPERLNTLTRPQGYLEILLGNYISTNFKKADLVAIPKYSGITNFKYAETVEED